MTAQLRRRSVLLAAGAGLAGLQACQPHSPWKLGFMGPLSARAADLGEGGRNGAILAVEQVNQNGGVAGQQVELLVQDDAQDVAQAQQAMKTLIEAQVHAVIGPFTSTMAAAVLPQANASGMLLMAPTVTESDLFGMDDALFLVSANAAATAARFARELLRRGQRRLAVAYDLGNRRFTESWLKEFSRAMAPLQGQLLVAEPFTSQIDTSFSRIVERLLAVRPDGVLLLAGAVDVARLTQRLRHSDARLPVTASEWAATEVLLELGGRAVEGLLSLKNYNPDDAQQPYSGFRDAYEKRFERLPDYASVAAYDSAQVLMAALSKKRSDESLKRCLIDKGPWPGLQQAIKFNSQGEADRQAWFVEIHDHHFVVQP